MQKRLLMLRLLHKACFCWLIVGCSALATEMSFVPEHPTLHDTITIYFHDCSQPGVLHWGVNAEGHHWDQPITSYRPKGSTLDGTAIRSRLAGPDADGVCVITLGPFLHKKQSVRSIDFAVQWDDQTWMNNHHQDFHIPVSSARITLNPPMPTINDVVEVRIHRSSGAGHLRWGVNAVHEQWQPPHSSYWPNGSIPSEDGLAIDSPFGAPDKDGISVLRFGPFNEPDQVVKSLHMAVHWDDVWDTDFGKNYNVVFTPDASPEAPHVNMTEPTPDVIVRDLLNVRLTSERAEGLSVMINDELFVEDTDPAEEEYDIPLNELKYGKHRLTVRATNGKKTCVDEVTFWKMPEVARTELPSTQADGSTLFTLHAPGKRFVSLVGDFNGWDPDTDIMQVAKDGTWWIEKKLTPGRHVYQFNVDGSMVIADPYAQDIEWKNEQGKESYHPHEAKSVMEVGAPRYSWSVTNFQTPSLDNLAIYEFHIDDLCPGQGFTGVIEKLDYIRDMGFTAIQPMPFHEFTKDTSWGYNPAFHFAPESAYGTPNDLKKLIDATHERGLAFIMDTVLNHMDKNGALYQLYGSDYEQSPYFQDAQGDNWGFPDLEQTSAAFKRYAKDVIEFWIEAYRIDGIRYDATRFVDWNGYNDWGASWFAYVGRQKKSDLIQISEHLPSDPKFINETEMDSTWHEIFRWRFREMIVGGYLDREEFERLMDPKGYGYSNVIGRMTYTESHDEERVMRELQQAGYSKDECFRRALLAITLTLMAPGTAMIYSGQEFAENTPKIVGSNPLDWSKLGDKRIQFLFQNTCKLLQLRSTFLPNGKGGISFDEKSPKDVATFVRETKNGPVYVVMNFGKKIARVAIKMPHDKVWFDLFAQEHVTTDVSNRCVFQLRPGEVKVLCSSDK